MTFRLSRLLLSALLVSGVPACGGGDVPAPTMDAGDTDAAPSDAGPGDAAIDAGHVDAAACPDEDNDGHGAAWCDDDCDDTDPSRYPGATEVCDSLDNDCDGTADDGVCVPCATGYTGVDDACTDIDECAAGAPYGDAVGATCANTMGSYLCTCPMGYAAPLTGGTCSDIDECAIGTDDCDRDPAATCANTVGSYTCTCPAGFTSPAGDARGADGCLLSNPSLSSLVPSVRTLSPAFAGGTTTYMLTLPSGATSLTLTPSVAYPMRATVAVDGVTVASGAASAPLSSLGFAPVPVQVMVATESGATRTYTVVVGRSSAYVKASNTRAGDTFGSSVSLSADGTRLAVGARYEGSRAASHRLN